MSDDLVKRLRAKVDVGSSLLDGLSVNPDGPEAADRIEALTAENERLRGVLIEIRDCTGEHGGAAKALKLISAALGEKQ